MTDAVEHSSDYSEQSSGTAESATKSVQMTQAELDALIGGVKRTASEKGLMRGKAEASQELETLKEELRREAQEAARAALDDREEKARKKEVERQEQEEADKHTQLVQTVKARVEPKFEAAKQKYADWNDEVESIDWNRPDYGKVLAILAPDTSIENPEDVLHHICVNGHLDKLASRSPSYIASKLREINASIESSKADVAEKPVHHEPVKSLKPSHVSNKGDGDLTVADYRKRYRV